MPHNVMACLDPRVKLIAFIIAQVLLFIPWAEPLFHLGLIFLPLLLLLPISGKSWHLWLRTVTLALPLLIFLAASAFLHPGSPHQAALWAALMVSKTLLVFLALALFIQNEKPGRFLQALRQSGLPQTMAVVFTLGLRFAGQLHLELQGMHRAWLGHNFHALPTLQRAKYLAKALPQFFERLMDSSTHLHDAMLARGFNGTLPYTHVLTFKGRDLIFLAWVIGVSVGIILL